ncbi:MAG: class I SAM-dependent methyltransferase [Akkermansiaceae bacterium]|nr:class I SAM-dependent methyltransferase [Akkermansiaceae bacterium]
MPRVPSCRFDGKALEHVFADLGMTPLANAYPDPRAGGQSEPFYPLRAHICPECFLVQLEEYESPEAIFQSYAYFSSFSEGWLRHAETYCRDMTGRFGIGRDSLVVEIASNDGYLLQYFHQEGVPVLGIEPAENVARTATEKGIETLVRFFGVETAKELAAEGRTADLLLGNNVLAHVPDLNDFVAGMKVILGPSGIITMEFPHLLNLMTQNQFDTIYHEHFSYFSFLTVERVFARHGITLFDVEELPTHGGSLRIFGRHEEAAEPPVTANVERLKKKELEAGLDQLNVYLQFGEQVKETKRKLLSFLIEAKRAGKSIVAYGAAAKGNTLLNYCGVGRDFIDYVVDRSPHKQGFALPGTHIPIEAPSKVGETRPDYLLILPWNLREEIMEQMAAIRDWGGQFVVPIPETTVYP